MQLNVQQAHQLVVRIMSALELGVREALAAGCY
jgi:hypothetical protein